MKLSEAEIRVGTWLGKQRRACNTRANVKQGLVGPVTLEADIEGVLGELAFCKMMNLYPDMEVKVQAHSFDCLYKTLRIDVKTSKYKQARLLVDIRKKAEDCDIYALMVGENGEYECAGWTYAWAIVNNSCIMDLGHGDSYGLSQDDLLPLYHLKEMYD